MSSEPPVWTHIRLPAIAEEDEHYEFETAFGRQRFVRKAGEPLNPQRQSAQSLREIFETIGPYNASAQYQQRPVPVEGVLVKPQWLQPFDLDRFERGRGHVYQAWDTATKSGELNDYSVCVTFVEIDNHFFLRHVFRQKLDYPDLKNAVIAQCDLFKPDTILIEDKSSGTQLIQEFEVAGLYNVVAIMPSSSIDKIMRFRAVTPLFAAGRVHVPIKAPWLNDYLDELFAFPGSRHDDQIDATAHALAFIRSEADVRAMWDKLAD